MLQKLKIELKDLWHSSQLSFTLSKSTTLQKNADALLKNVDSIKIKEVLVLKIYIF